MNTLILTILLANKEEEEETKMEALNLTSCTQTHHAYLGFVVSAKNRSEEKIVWLRGGLYSSRNRSGVGVGVLTKTDETT